MENGQPKLAVPVLVSEESQIVSAIQTFFKQSKRASFLSKTPMTDSHSKSLKAKFSSVLSAEQPCLAIVGNSV